jgi:hypothetical protein
LYLEETFWGKVSFVGLPHPQKFCQYLIFRQLVAPRSSWGFQVRCGALFGFDSDLEHVTPVRKHSLVVAKKRHTQHYVILANSLANSYPVPQFVKQ